MKFRKKPVVIEAFRYCWISPRPIWFNKGVDAGTIKTFGDHCLIDTLEGVMKADVGDYIIQGIKGEIYPCKPDIFEATYEAVEDLNPMK